MMNHALYREVQSPTSVEQAVWGHLLSPDSLNLATASNNTLAIYTLGTLPYGKNLPTAPSDAEFQDSSQLQLLRSFNLHGIIGSMQVLTLPEPSSIHLCGRADLQALVLGFAESKVSVVVLDPTSLSLKTLALFNFEDEGVSPGVFFPNFKKALHQDGIAGTGQVVIDSASRAVANVAYNNQIVYMPLRLVDASNTFTPQFSADPVTAAEAAAAIRSSLDKSAAFNASTVDAALKESLVDALGSAAVQQDVNTLSVFQKPFLLDLETFGAYGDSDDSGVGGTIGGVSGTIRDVCFLRGYDLKPAIAVLVERVPTSASRLDSLRNTCTLVVLSVDARTQRTTVLWRKDRLPHDAFKLQPVPERLGGVLVFSTSAILYFNHSRYCGLAVNAFAVSTVDVRGRYPLDTNKSHEPFQPQVCLALDGCTSTFLSDSCALVSSKDGTLFLLHLCSASGISSEVHHLVLEATAIRSVPVCSFATFVPPLAVQEQLQHMLSSVCSGGFVYALVFSCCRVGDSSLSILAAKTARVGETSVAYHSKLLEAGVSSSTAPEDSAVGQKRSRAAIEPRTEDDEAFLYGGAHKPEPSGLQTVTGHDSDTSETAISSSLYVYVVDSLLCVGPVADSSLGRERKTMDADDEDAPLSAPLTELALCAGNDFTGAVFVGNRGLRPMPVAELRLSGCVGAWFIAEADAQLLVLSMHNGSTRILAGLVELGSEEHGFVGHAPTVGVLKLVRGEMSVFCQVHERGVRVVRANTKAEFLEDMTPEMLQLGAGAKVVASDASDHVAALRTSDGKLILLSYDGAKVSANALEISGTLPGDAVTASCVFYHPSASHFAGVGAGEHVVVACFRSGRLVVSEVPSGRVVFECCNAQRGDAVLVHSANMDHSVVKVPRTYVRDISLRINPSNNVASLVMMSCFDDVLIYEWRPQLNTASETALPSDALFDFAASSLPTHAEAESDLLSAIRSRAADVKLAGSPPNRFVRLHAACSLATRSEAADKLSDSAREAILRERNPPRLVFFGDVGGWAGWACLGALPCWLLMHRGSVVTLPIGIPDVTGAAGPSALPGDLLHTANVVSAFTPFHSPQCPFGYVWSHQGFVQFAQLPRPTWPTPWLPQDAVTRHAHRDTALRPRRIPYGLVYALDGAQSIGFASPGLLDAVLEHPVPINTVAYCNPAYPDEHRIADVAPHAASSVWFRYSMYASVHKIAYLEHSSSALGAQSLRNWHQTKRATAISVGKPAPVPPTVTQLACCVQPMYVIVSSSLRFRDHTADMKQVETALAADGGEQAQMTYGEHLEYADAAAAVDSARSDVLSLGHTWPYTKEFSIGLYAGTAVSGPCWQQLGESVTLHPHEHVLCVAEVPLMEKGVAVGTILVGTGYVTPRGEDAISTGRLLGFRVVECLTDGVPAFKLSQIVEIPFTAPVSSIAALTGETRHVVLGIGKSLQVREWRQDRTKEDRFTLEWIAFHESSSWVRDIATFGQYVLIGDLYSSVRFVQWRDQDRQVLAKARDQYKLNVVAADMLVLDNMLGLFVIDDDNNAVILRYNPKEHSNRLVTECDFHLGAGVDSTLRSRMAVPTGTASQRRKFCISFGTFDGSFASVVPLDDAQCVPLLALQQWLCYGLSHIAGLNPARWRAFTSVSHPARPRANNFVDGNLLSEFLHLDQSAQRAFATAAGSSLDKIMELLRYVDLSVMTY